MFFSRANYQTSLDLGLVEETKILFREPSRLHANDSYALIILTSSPHFRIRTATIGHVGENGIITRKTPSSSLLLASEEAENWKSLDDSILQMAIYGYEFQAIGEVRFKKISGLELTGLSLDTVLYTLGGADITCQYSTDGGSTWNTLIQNKNEDSSTIVTEVIVRANLMGVLNFKTPILNYRDILLLGYNNQSRGVYITKELRLLHDVFSTKVYAQLDIPEGTDVKWYASNDGGVTWETVLMEITRAINQEWIEHVGIVEFTETTGMIVQYKAELFGNTFTFPRIHTTCAIFV